MAKRKPAPDSGVSRGLARAWGLSREELDGEDISLLNVEHGDGSVMVWSIDPEVDGPPISSVPPVAAPDGPSGMSGWLAVEMVPSAATVAEQRRSVGLPATPFLYTLDQIAQMVSLPHKKIVDQYLHFAGITPGLQDPERMLAANLAQFGEEADWRVGDAEFIRWLRHKGFRVFDAWKLTRG